MTTITQPIPATADQIPPGPQYNNIISMMGFINAFSKDALGLLDRFRDQYGANFTIRLSNQTQVMISDAAMIHEITVTQASKFRKPLDYTDPKRGLARFMGNGLVTSNGDFWKRQRKMVAPSMHAKRIMNYADTMTALTTEQLKHWQAGTRLDISEEMMSLTMKIIATTGFNVAVSDEQIRKISSAMEGLQGVSGAFSIIPPWVPTPTELRARQGLRDIDEIIYGIIDERRRTGEDKGDLLSMLLLAEDDQGQHMSAKEARDEAVTMILAGHETTANALNWTFYLLAQHPEIEAKLHEELDTVLAGRVPTLADLENLKYTEMVIKESMRLMPPVWSFAREAIETVKIGPYTIPQGSTVNVITLHAHQDTRYYPDPKRFDPERFTPENEAKLPRGAYIPFGGGPRICIGFSFAMMEARLLLATIASQYKLRLEPGQRVTPQAQVTLNPKGGLPMTVLAR